MKEGKKGGKRGKQLTSVQVGEHFVWQSFHLKGKRSLESRFLQPVPSLFALKRISTPAEGGEGEACGERERERERET